MTVIFAKPSRLNPDGSVPLDGGLVSVELPANCAVTSADHIGLTTADLAALLSTALEIGRHWNDQDGVNGALLDRLGMLASKADASDDSILERRPSPAGAVHMRVVRMVPELPVLHPGELVRWLGREWSVRTITGNPNRGHYAVEFNERGNAEEGYGWDVSEIRAAANNSSDDMAAVGRLRHTQETIIDDAAMRLIALGHLPTEMRIVYQDVQDRGQVRTIELKGRPVFEMVTTSPGLKHEGERYSVDFTVTCQWLTEI